MSKKGQKASQGGSKNKLVALLLLLFLICIIAVLGYVHMELEGVKSHVASDNSASGVTLSPKEIADPVYVPLEPFTVSLKPEGDGVDHVLYIGVTFQENDQDGKKMLMKYLPEVKSRLLLLVSQQTATVLSTSEGKTQLIKQIKDTVSKPLAGKQTLKITDILFNIFILR